MTNNIHLPDHSYFSLYTTFKSCCDAWYLQLPWNCALLPWNRRNIILGLTKRLFYLSNQSYHFAETQVARYPSYSMKTKKDHDGCVDMSINLTLISCFHWFVLPSWVFRHYILLTSGKIPKELQKYLQTASQRPNSWTLFGPCRSHFLSRKSFVSS